MYTDTCIYIFMAKGNVGDFQSKRTPSKMPPRAKMNNTKQVFECYGHENVYGRRIKH